MLSRVESEHVNAGEWLPFCEVIAAMKLKTECNEGWAKCGNQQRWYEYNTIGL